MKPARRRRRRNVLLGAGIASSLAALRVALGEPQPWYAWSLGTAYVSTALLAVTLLLGPLNRMRRRPDPVSTYLRRDIGIWGALVGAAHVVIGLQRHMGGDMLVYFLTRAPDGAPAGLRTDLFGVANWIGLVATLVLALLLALSNDRSLRALGSGRWKRWQRLNYLLGPLVLMHGVAFQAQGGRLAWGGGALLLMAAPVLVARWRARRAGAAGADAGTLSGRG